MGCIDFIFFLTDVPIFIVALCRLLSGKGKIVDFLFVIACCVGVIFYVLSKTNRNREKMQALLIISPSKNKVLLFLIAIIAMTVALVFLEDVMPMVHIVCFVLFCVIAMIPGTTFYFVYPGYLRIHYLWIPVRRVYWHELSNVIFTSTRRNDGVHITFINKKCTCNDVSPKALAVNMFMHPLKMTYIFVPAHLVERCEMTIRECCKDKNVSINMTPY